MAAEKAAVAVIPSNGDPDGSRFKEYEAMYQYSITRPEEFWAKEAMERLSWVRPFDAIKGGSLKEGNQSWFMNGQINACYNCCDRHDPDKVAITWEGNEPTDTRHITYGEMTKRVCQYANVLKSRGVGKGDNIVIYMPMIPETAFAMLACARIGAVHSVVFAGFSAESLKARVVDANAVMVMTSDFGLRGPKKIALKKIVDDALVDCPAVKDVLVFKRLGDECPWVEGRDNWLDGQAEFKAAEGAAFLADSQRPYCPCEPLDAEDVLFLLYTSGSTGKPKGIMHTIAGYMLYSSMTFDKVFNYQDGDVYACVADVGWITGHSYIVYGPLCRGANTMMFESLPTYPDNGRYWDMVQRHKINIFYTAPTAIRALMKAGNEPVERYDRSSLKTLGTVGEPINPEAWQWYYDVVGEGRCDIVDTMWQTETGGHIITGLSGTTPMKPGSASFPFFGIELAVLEATVEGAEGGGAIKEIQGNDVSGILAIKDHWPGMVRTVGGDHNRFMNTYLTPYPGYYFAGDGCYRDKDGYYWITGRVDDVLNVSGHRLGTAEIEAAMGSHEACAEAAVVGVPHEIKGEGIFAYAILRNGFEGSPEICQALRQQVRKAIGGIAMPDQVILTPALPKTRSGKIMRRVLRKIAAGEHDSLGDVSTLADPSVVGTLVELVAASKA